ncbi:uroporphyrinogen-III C-methyltransferase [Sphingosinicella soli]|uniref:uroporphyrinogen-III C-methyltransferase n=1 Tax=Sphingosinicella soli TaxID=333708 RepID=A0A7W7B3D2_9SPHN|nr:uroporphyrinogen-III C-methyltransferase [Sphingosinicella soli]MBB4633282.1 uroporphyrin-III C-methyltransferase [Sphingosinicella soli]
MAEPIAPGEVWLVGAGPGDPELLTRKAEKLIGAASVIFFDALVSRDILALAPAEARCIPVGKRSGRHSKTQKEINRLLVSAALAGERVVRLKGGDPSIFGRSAEEVAALAAAGISARICPGITAASAAAAGAGISLTLRGVAQRFQCVTAHARAGEPLSLDWKALADPAATLAIYMGRGAAPEIAARLMHNGLASDTSVLVAANVSLPNAILIRTRLDLLPLTVKSIDHDAPVLLLIGSATALHAELPCAGPLIRSTPTYQNPVISFA